MSGLLLTSGSDQASWSSHEPSLSPSFSEIPVKVPVANMRDPNFSGDLEVPCIKAIPPHLTSGLDGFIPKTYSSLGPSEDFLAASSPYFFSQAFTISNLCLEGFQGLHGTTKFFSFPESISGRRSNCPIR